MYNVRESHDNNIILSVTCIYLYIYRYIYMYISIYTQGTYRLLGRRRRILNSVNTLQPIIRVCVPIYT